MSEANKHNPNISKPKLTSRGKAAAFALTAALGASAGIGGHMEFQHISSDMKLQSQLSDANALASYKRGEIDPSKAIVIKVTDADNGTPDGYAISIKNKNSVTSDLSSEIRPQADGQGYPGVEPGELYVVNRDLLSEQAIDELAVQEPILPPLPGAHK